MTSRSSKNAVRGFETEIEKCREEGNWKRSIELATQLKARSPQHESLAHFLLGEGELEGCLESLGSARLATGVAVPAALETARGWLEQAAGAAGRRAGVALDAHLLLAKLHYALGDTDAALEHYDLAELSTLTEKELPVRSLRIVAESFALRALCLEARARPEEAARCLATAALLGARWAQRCPSAACPVLQGALAAAGRLHARSEPHRALAACRDLLTAVEAPALSPLRLGAARTLAELLLRAHCPAQWTPPPVVHTSGGWRPQRYSQPNQLVPRAWGEELLLALLLAEAMAAREAVLSQAAEFSAARDHALRQAVTVADLLAVCAPRHRLLCLVQEALDRAMKFSFGARHVWRQRALARCAHDDSAQSPPLQDSEAWQSSARAVAVCERALALSPDDAALRLVCARACVGAGRMQRAVHWAEEARALGGPLQARAALEAGAAWQAIAEHAACPTERAHADSKALELLLIAAKGDPNDHLALARLALQHARAARLNDALQCAHAALKARADCPLALKLTTALWSAAGASQRRYRAVAAARLAHDQYPRAEWPLAALGALQAARSPDAALAAGRALLALVARSALPGATSALPYAELDALSEAETALSGRDSASSRAGAVIQRSLAERRAAAWLALAALLLRLERAPAAAGCVAEAASLTPNNHLVFYTRGKVHAALGEWQAARLAFTDALALKPDHADTLLQLGGALHALNCPRAAEGALRGALAAGGTTTGAEGYRQLALVLAALHEPLPAADAAAAALNSLPHTPALPLPTP